MYPHGTGNLTSFGSKGGKRLLHWGEDASPDIIQLNFRCWEELLCVCRMTSGILRYLTRIPFKSDDQVDQRSKYSAKGKNSQVRLKNKNQKEGEKASDSICTQHCQLYTVHIIVLNWIDIHELSIQLRIQ